MNFRLLARLIEFYKHALKYRIATEDIPIIFSQLESLKEDWDAPGMEGVFISTYFIGNGLTIFEKEKKMQISISTSLQC